MGPQDATRGDVWGRDGFVPMMRVCRAVNRGWGAVGRGTERGVEVDRGASFLGFATSMAPVCPPF